MNGVQICRAAKTAEDAVDAGCEELFDSESSIHSKIHSSEVTGNGSLVPFTLVQCSAA